MCPVITPTGRAAYAKGIAETGRRHMDYLDIEGGYPLRGEARIQGSKNAALPILSGALLHSGVTVLKNCPDITDVTGHAGASEGL